MVIGVMRRVVGVLERAERLLVDEREGVSLLSAVSSFDVVDAAGELVSSKDLLRTTTIVLLLSRTALHAGLSRLSLPNRLG